jgi:hypothetical protein
MLAANRARFWRVLIGDLFSEALPAMMHHGAAVLEFPHDYLKGFKSIQ